MESDERFKNELENATAGVASLTFKPRSSHDEAGTTMTSAEKTNTRKYAFNTGLFVLRSPLLF